MEETLKKSVKCIKEVLSFLEKVKEKKYCKEKNDLIANLRSFLAEAGDLIPSADFDSIQQDDDYIDVAVKSNSTAQLQPPSTDESLPSPSKIHPVPCEQLQDISISDFLELKRKTLMAGAWIKRWCVLHGSVLYMYEKSKDKKQKEAIDITNCTVTITNEITKEIKRKNRCFELKNEEINKAYEFCASDDASALVWKQRLENPRKIGKNDKPKLDDNNGLYEDTAVGAPVKASHNTVYDDTIVGGETYEDTAITKTVPIMDDTYIDVESQASAGKPKPPSSKSSLPKPSSITSRERRLPSLERFALPEAIPFSVDAESPPPFDLPSSTQHFDISNLPPPPPVKDADKGSGSGMFGKSSAALLTPDKGPAPPLPKRLETPEFTIESKQPQSNDKHLHASSEELSSSSNSQIKPIPCEQLRDASMSDFLELKKKTLMTGGWIKRWCVLHGNVLYMYEKSKDKKQKEAFSLACCNVTLSKEITKETKRKNRCFEVKNAQTNKIYEFCAGDEESLHKWKRCLEKACFIGDGDVYEDTQVIVSPKLDPSVYDDTEEVEATFNCKQVSNSHSDELEETYDEVDFSPSSERELPSAPGTASSSVSNAHCLPPLISSSSPEPIPFSTDPKSPPPFNLPSAKQFDISLSLPPTQDASHPGCGNGTPQKSAVMLLNPDKPFLPAVPPRSTTPELECFRKDDSFNAKEDEEKYRDDLNPDEDTLNTEELYQGMWDCWADDENELSFERGQLVHIISKEYDIYGWWVAGRDNQVGLVPKEYLMEAYQ